MQPLSVKLNLERGHVRILGPMYLGSDYTLSYDIEGTYSLAFTEPVSDKPREGATVLAQNDGETLSLRHLALREYFEKANALQPNVMMPVKVWVLDPDGRTLADGETAIEYSPADYLIDAADYPTARETLEKARQAQKDAESAARLAGEGKASAETAKEAALAAQGAAETAKTSAETARNAALCAAAEAKTALSQGSQAIAGAVAGEEERAKAEEKAIRTETAQALAAKADLVNGRVPAAQLPAAVDEIIEMPSCGDFTIPGESNKIYLAIDTNKVYRWSGSQYVEVSQSIALGETSSTAFPGNRGKAAEEALAAEVKRAKDAEAALAGRVNELEEKSSVEVVAPSPNGEGKAADAKAVYEALERKRDRTDNIAAADSLVYTEWKYHCDVPEIQAALDGSSDVRFDYSPDPEGWVFSGLPEVEGWTKNNAPFSPGTADALTIKSVSQYYREDPVSGDYIAKAIIATREKITYTKQGEPYVTPTGVGSVAIPKYPFVNAAITDGAVTVAPYTNAKLVSDGTAFSVAVGGDSAYMRDCALRVECGDTVPTITWPANFHPRTDAETDFKCEAGKRNVYWISEYAPNEFVVAGWQETTGGNVS